MASSWPGPTALAAPHRGADGDLREITAAGGHFVVAEMGMDIRPDDPHGETMLVHSLQQARVQYLQIKNRWALSRGNAVKAGKAMGSRLSGIGLRTPRLEPMREVWWTPGSFPTSERADPA